MGLIGDFARSFFYEYRDYTLPTTVLVIPAAILIIRTGIQVYKNPGVFKEKFHKLKNRIHLSFAAIPAETKKAHRTKVLKNTALVATFTLMSGGAIGLSFYQFPTPLAIPVACLAIIGTGNAISYSREVPSKIRKVKTILTESFKPIENETAEEFKSRCSQMTKKIARYSLAGLSLAALTGVGAYFAIQLMRAKGYWTPISLKTNLGVYATYGTLGFAHSLQTLYYFTKQNNPQIILHVTAAVASILFPLGHWLGDTMRLHHSAWGLLSQVAPSVVLQTFGIVIAGDSALYFFSRERCETPPDGDYSFCENYDFMNTIVDKRIFAMLSIAGLTLAELLLSHLLALSEIKEDPLILDTDLEGQELDDLTQDAFFESEG